VVRPVEPCDRLVRILVDADDRRWPEFNARRSTATIPSGEHPLGVQRRIVDALGSLHAAHPRGTVAVVTHADVIRFALLHYLDAPLDDYATLTVEPASVSELVLSAQGARVLSIGMRCYPATTSRSVSRSGGFTR
jgi:broad specificity phosphatase PhoE